MENLTKEQEKAKKDQLAGQAKNIQKGAQLKQARAVKEYNDFVGYKQREVSLIRSMIAKDTSDTELTYFLKISKGLQLNPLTKEIWCYKDNRGNLLIFAGIDGFRTVAQRDKQFKGVRASEVCKNDKFVLDIANNKIEHTFGVEDRGEIIGAYAIAFKKDGEPTIEWADIKTYDKKQHAWASHKAEMIKKVAEIHALKKAFGIHGLYGVEEFNIQDGIVQDTPANDNFEKAKKLIAGMKDKEMLIKACSSLKKNKEFSDEEKIELDALLQEKIGSLEGKK